MTREDVQSWLDAYVEAWRTYDPASIAALFTEDAAYAYHPWDEGEEVVRGRDAIVENWFEEQDQPGSWEAQYRTLLVEGERAVATGTTSYAGGELLEPVGAPLRRRWPLRRVRRVVHGSAAGGDIVEVRTGEQLHPAWETRRI